METLLLNLTGATRFAELNGKRYIVAPMVMISPGVLNGSKGPLYYPLEEIAANADDWNGIPIVVNHPTLNGKPVSARSPEVLEQYGIGYVFKAVANGKLSAEAWIDVEKAESIDTRIVDSLNAGIKLEVSTGLFVDQEAADEGATFNDKAYTHVARNFRPDHLAVLPDTIGACSIEDGCGVLVNKCKCQTENPVTKEPSMAKKELVDNLIANCSCWEDADRETLNTLSDSKLQGLIDAAKPAEPAEEVVENQVETSFEDEAGNVHTWNSETQSWETKIKEVEADDAEPVDNAKPAKAMTKAEWLEIAPEEVRRAVENAINIEAKQRADIIESIVANLEGEAKERLVKHLDVMDIASLQDFQVLNTVKKEEPKKDGSLGSFFGQAGAPAPKQEQTNNQAPQVESLNVPHINYKELSKSL